VLAYGPSPGGTCTASGTFASDDAAQSEIVTKCTSTTATHCAAFGGAVAINNVNFQPSCGNDSGCIANSSCTTANERIVRRLVQRGKWV
jgi:hypothetical protein